jgi:hypothetical protein
MSMLKRQFRPRNLLICVIILCAASYTACLASLHLTPLSSAANSTSTDATSDAPISSRDVPDSVLQALQMHLTDVPDLQEWAVLPAVAGNGYSVSATVELALNGGVGQNNDAVDRDIMAFFQGVYGSGADVADAHIYFLQDGRPVAGAGLGQSTYRNLGVTASTTPATFANVIAAQPMRTSDGPDDCWFESTLDDGGSNAE